jgi:hypothetical protein
VFHFPVRARSGCTLFRVGPSGGKDFEMFDAKARFLQFDRENPTIFKLFEKETSIRISYRDGRMERLSAKHIWEVLRKVHFLKSLNNDFTPFYARKFMAKHRKYAGLFETRKQRSFTTNAVAILRNRYGKQRTR